MPHDDDTVILRPSRKRPGRTLMFACVAGVALLGMAGAGGFLLARQRPVPVATVAAPAPKVPPIPLASEAAIRDENPAARTVLRFAANPAVLVIDLPTLAEQGRMFNRLAAWAEKAGVAHDRVPSEEVLAAAIQASGTTADTYYYGHDYRGSDVMAFFALAARDHMALRPEEEELRGIATRAAAEPAGFGAVITLVRADAANGVSPEARATILHHELSHGEYFTDPAYAGFVHTVWQSMLDPAERATFRTYLAREGYDPALEDLMQNEMQAYLMHTPNPEFFDPRRLAITASRLAQIREGFLAGMPPGWLRDELAASGTVPAGPVPAVPAGPAPAVPARALPGGAAGAARPRRRQRRCQRAGRVSIRVAAADTAPPRRRRASVAVPSAAR